MKFELSKSQLKQVKEWDDSKSGHKCAYKPEHGAKKYCGAIGGHLSYTFTPTSIGDVIEVNCGCGAKLDITEDF